MGLAFNYVSGVSSSLKLPFPETSWLPRAVSTHPFSLLQVTKVEPAALQLSKEPKSLRPQSRPGTFLTVRHCAEPAANLPG